MRTLMRSSSLARPSGLLLSTYRSYASLDSQSSMNSKTSQNGSLASEQTQNLKSFNSSSTLASSSNNFNSESLGKQNQDADSSSTTTIHLKVKLNNQSLDKSTDATTAGSKQSAEEYIDEADIPRVTPVTNKAHFSEPPPAIDDSDISLENLKKTVIEEKLRLLNSNSGPIIRKSSKQPKITAQQAQSYLDLNAIPYEKISSFSDLPVDFGYNQHMAIDNQLKEKLRSILWKFNAPIKYAFAYGSGVFSQGKASDSTKPQVDMIFGVSYTQHWHSLNMRQNPHHYSFLRHFGSGLVSKVQDNLGSGVYFNPFVEIDGIKIKYGVVNIDTLLTDLTNWNTLYLAGRLHKPVKILRDEPRIRFTNQANLISALRTALLILPEKFSELDLYRTLAGISYMGDLRTTFKGLENPNKVENIVQNQFLNFRNLYSPLLDILPNVKLNSSAAFALDSNRDIGVATMAQDMDPIKRGNMVVRLPNDFRNRLYQRYQSKYQRIESDFSVKNLDILDPSKNVRRDGTAFDRAIASDPELPQIISNVIRNTVAWPSFTQSVKGILTAGIGRSVKYALAKLNKAQSK